MIFDEPFASGQTWVHALDPRLRLCTAFLLSCAFAAIGNCRALIYGLVASAFLLLCSRPPFRPLLRRLAGANLFLLFLWLTVPCFTPGHTLFSLGPLVFSQEGLTLVTQITLKANAITLLFLACVATIPISLFGHALQSLGLPLKLVYLLLFTYRAIFLLAEEWAHLQVSLKLHNFVPRSNLHSYRTFGYLFGMTIARSIDRAQRVHEAMLLRGFQGHFISLAHFQFRWQDTCFVTMTLAFFLFFLATTFSWFSPYVSLFP